MRSMLPPVMVVVFAVVAPGLAGDKRNAIRDLLFETTQDARQKLHEAANQCINKLAAIPAEQKTAWCRDELSRRLAQEERSLRDESRRLGAGCTDDDCRKRAALNNKVMESHQQERVDQLKEQLGRCDKEATLLLEQRCKQIESSFHPPTD